MYCFFPQIGGHTGNSILDNRICNVSNDHQEVLCNCTHSVHYQALIWSFSEMQLEAHNLNCVMPLNFNLDSGLYHTEILPLLNTSGIINSKIKHVEDFTIPNEIEIDTTNYFNSGKGTFLS